MTVTILQGGALSGLLTLPSESVQCVVTSPPYYGLRDYGVDGQIGLERSPLAFLEALWAIFDEVRRVLRRDGICFVNIGDSYAGSGKGPSNSLQRPASCLSDRLLENGTAPKVWLPVGDGLKPKDLMLIPQRFAIGMQDRGWWVRSEIVWAKTSAMPESVRDRPTSAWEPIWMFTKSRTYFWDADAVRQAPVAAPQRRLTAHKYGRGPAEQNGATILRGVPMHDAPEAGANLRNYWLLSPEPSSLEHYAGFPTELPRRCIKAASRPGDTVLDPFLGSGTTALVADQLGRHAIGIELNPRYVEMARRRIESDAPMVQEPVSVATPTQAGMFDEAAS